MNQESNENWNGNAANISEEKKNQTDLSKGGVAKQIAIKIEKDIEAFAKKEYDDGHRSHLGASLIGEDCLMKLWLIFRWCAKENFDGRMLRLFQRGHREEQVFIEYLRGIGCKVIEYDYEADPLYLLDNGEYILKSDLIKSGREYQPANIIDIDNLNLNAHINRAILQGVKPKQLRVAGIENHFGGSLDGIVYLPPEYGYDKPLLVEFKTNGTGAAFNKLTKHGMAVGKPMHFAQTCVYGYKNKIDFCLYMNVNKNDDSMHIEIVELDHKYGAQQERKAQRVIMSQEPMPRVSPTSTAMSCQWCDFKDVCHNKKLPEKNCRSCKFAEPAADARWHCNKWNSLIPNDKEILLAGCGEWSPIINGD